MKSLVANNYAWEGSGAPLGVQGVKNPGENNVHDKYSTCCLKTVSEDGNPGYLVCCGHGCTKPEVTGTVVVVSKVR